MCFHLKELHVQNQLWNYVNIAPRSLYRTIEDRNVLVAIGWSFGNNRYRGSAHASIGLHRISWISRGHQMGREKWISLCRMSDICRDIPQLYSFLDHREYGTPWLLKHIILPVASSYPRFGSCSINVDLAFCSRVVIQFNLFLILNLDEFPLISYDVGRITQHVRIEIKKEGMNKANRKKGNKEKR